MKRNGSRLIALVLLAGIASYGAARAADDPAAPPEKAPEPTRREFRVMPPGAAEGLKLTTEQQKDIADLEKDVQAKMAKILTPEQLDQWNKSRPDGARGRRTGVLGRRGQPSAGPNAEGPPRASGGPDRGIRELKLTDEQKSKVEEIFKDNREKMRAFMEGQRAELVKALKGVLSDDQQKDIDKLLPPTGPTRGRGPGDGNAPPRRGEPPQN